MPRARFNYSTNKTSLLKVCSKEEVGWAFHLCLLGGSGSSPGSLDVWRLCRSREASASQPPTTTTPSVQDWKNEDCEQGHALRK